MTVASKYCFVFFPLVITTLLFVRACACVTSWPIAFAERPRFFRCKQEVGGDPLRAVQSTFHNRESSYIEIEIDEYIYTFSFCFIFIPPVDFPASCRRSESSPSRQLGVTTARAPPSGGSVSPRRCLHSYLLIPPERYTFLM